MPPRLTIYSLITAGNMTIAGRTSIPFYLMKLDSSFSDIYHVSGVVKGTFIYVGLLNVTSAV